MKRNYLTPVLMLTTFLLFFLISCTRNENLDNRLNKFKSLLSKNEIVLFIDLKKGDNQEKLINSLKKKYSSNKDFKIQLNKIKHTESIDLFSIKQVIEYYNNNFK